MKLRPQREYKFRAWDGWKMYDWTYLQEFQSKWLNADNRESSYLPMQFTGLKDKNGKEVYQGDILKVTADKEGYGSTSYGGYVEVVGETCGYSLKPFNPTVAELDEQWSKGGDGWDSTSLWHIEDDNGKNIEVIGNIYENPELLVKPTT